MDSGDLLSQEESCFVDKRSDVLQCVHEISYSRMHPFNEQALNDVHLYATDVAKYPR